MEAEANGNLFRRGRKRKCLRHGGSCELHSRAYAIHAPKALRLHVAGTACKDYSRRNAKALGILGPHNRAFLVWIFERRFEGEDIILIENSEAFDIDIVLRLLGDRYHIHVIKCGPEDLGWWVSRRRSYVILIKKDSTFSSSLNVSQFLALFGASRPMQPTCKRGNMFFAAPVDVLMSEKLRRWSKRYGAPAHAGRFDCSWIETLSLAHDARRSAFERVLVQRLVGPEIAEDIAASRVDIPKICRVMQDQFGMNGIADLDHNPGYGGMGISNELPTLISHGEYFSFSLARPLIGDEFFLAQGFPVHGFGPFPEILADCFSDWGLTDAQIKDLAGNSVHLHVVYCLLLWILGTLSAEETFQASPESVPAERLHGDGSVKSSALPDVSSGSASSSASSSDAFVLSDSPLKRARFE